MGAMHLDICPITISAGAALTPYRFVGTDKQQADNGDNTIGVSLAMAEAGEDTTIETLGVVSVEAGGAVTEGGLVQSDAQGRAVDRSAGAIVGRALSSTATAGEFVQVLLITN